MIPQAMLLYHAVFYKIYLINWIPFWDMPQRLTGGDWIFFNVL